MAALIDILPDDSLAVIRSRVLAAAEREVILIVPRNTAALRSAVGGKVLARLTVEHNLKLAVATRDSEVRRYVSDAGLSVFGNARDAQNARRWKSPPRDTRSLAESASARRQSAAEQAPASRSILEQLLAVSLTLVLLLILGGATILLLPEARVTVTPDTQDLAVEVRLSVVTDLEEISYEKVAIPGHKVTQLVQGTWSQPTTSRKDVPDEPAKGTVVFVNQRPDPVTIPAGTVVSTGSGVPVTFRTTEEVQLPGQRGASVPVPIEATEAGPQGNVSAYLINTVMGTLATQVTVINDQPTSGGTVGQVGVVTEADRQRLRAALLQRLESEANAAIQNMLPAGEVAPRETLSGPEVLGEAYDRMLGETAEQLTLTIRAEYSEIAFSTLDASRIAAAGLQGVVPENYHLLGETIRTEITAVEVTEQGMFITVIAQGTARALLDAERVRPLITGRTPEEAQQILSQSLNLAGPPEIDLSPDWVENLPLFSFRIQVKIKD